MELHNTHAILFVICELVIGNCTISMILCFGAIVLYFSSIRVSEERILMLDIFYAGDLSPSERRDLASLHIHKDIDETKRLRKALVLARKQQCMQEEEREVIHFFSTATDPEWQRYLDGFCQNRRVLRLA